MRSRFSLRSVYALYSAIAQKVATWISERRDVARSADKSPELLAFISSFQNRTAGLAVETPLVSVVISASHDLRTTLRCLQSIANVWVHSISVEIIVVDCTSKGGLSRAVLEIPGVEFVGSGRGLGYGAAHIRVVTKARGRYIYFLNDDLVVTDGWLDSLVDVVESDSAIGAVGSKIVLSDGRLEEAGMVMWRDASTVSYGTFDDSADPRYNFRRDVDCFSGASLLIRKELLEALGYFDRRFSSAAYQIADLCAGIRHLDRRVAYQPASVVVRTHGESPRSTTARGSVCERTIDSAAFEEKWRESLVRHYVRTQATSIYGAARRLAGSPRVLVIDTSVPKYDYDAGSLRLTHIMRLLLEAGTRVVLFPVRLEPLQPYTAELQQMGIEVLFKTTAMDDVEPSLTQALTETDVVWVCRPELADRFLPLLRRHRNIRIIYDTIDLHFIRKRRQAELTENAEGADWGLDRLRELACARRADVTITVTDAERKILEGFGIPSIYVVPSVHVRKTSVPPRYDRTEDLLFIGGYDHTPNVDAVEWLVSEIMPLVWQRLPWLRVTLLGSNPPSSVRALAGPNITVTGFLPDVDSYFRTHRVFVAPLRYGAGLKGKLGEAMSYGLPTVVTPIAAEGYDFVDGTDALIASDAQSFAKAIIDLYLDEKLWESISHRGLANVEKFSPDTIKTELRKIVGDVLANSSSNDATESAFDQKAAPKRIIIACSFRAGASYCAETIGTYLGAESPNIAFDRYAEHNLTGDMLAQLRGINFVTDLQMRPHSRNLNSCLDASIELTVLWRNLADAVVSFDNNTSRYGANNPVFYVDHQALVAMPSQSRYRYIIDSIVGWNLGFYLNWRRIPGTVLFPYEGLLKDSFGFFREMMIQLGFFVDDDRLESVVTKSNTNLHVDVVEIDNPLNEANRRHLERLILGHPEVEQLEVLIWELPWEPLELERRSPFDGHILQADDGDVFFVSSGCRRKVNASWLASRSPRLGMPVVVSDFELYELPRKDDLY